MRKAFRILFLLVFRAVLWAGAENLKCSVSQEDDLTTYSVSESKGTGCCYSWSNGTNHVLANEAEKPEYPVVNKDQTSLTTKKCIETVLYKLDCTSNDTPQKISCTVACRGNGGDGGSRIYWGAFIALGFLVVTILIIIIIAISCRKKKDIEDSADVV